MEQPDLIAITVTRSYLELEAKEFLTRLYGRPGHENDADKWMERFGLLRAFIDEQFTKKTLGSA